MSHDQKPGRMRVVGGRAAAPSRRREDIALDAGETDPALAGEGEAGANGRGRSQLLLAGLFVAGCVIGGVALPLARAG